MNQSAFFLWAFHSVHHQDIDLIMQPVPGNNQLEDIKSQSANNISGSYLLKTLSFGS